MLVHPDGGVRRGVHGDSGLTRLPEALPPSGRPLNGVVAGPAAHPAPLDRRSLVLLVAANVFTLVLALAQDWPIALLLWPYWVQSVVIGVFSYRRIMGLQRFSTEGFRINRRSVAPTDEARRTTACFFALHYGLFHLAYALFLSVQQMPARDWLWVGVAAVGFLYNHWQSFERFHEADRQGCPNIGTLMFLPYLRVVPMHLAVIVGAAVPWTGAVLLFGLLKTAADCVMHVAEHRILARAGRAAG